MYHNNKSIDLYQKHKENIQAILFSSIGKINTKCPAAVLRREKSLRICHYTTPHPCIRIWPYDIFSPLVEIVLYNLYCVPPETALYF